MELIRATRPLQAHCRAWRLLNYGVSILVTSLAMSHVTQCFFIYFEEKQLS